MGVGVGLYFRQGGQERPHREVKTTTGEHKYELLPQRPWTSMSPKNGRRTAYLENAGKGGTNGLTFLCFL